MWREIVLYSHFSGGKFYYGKISYFSVEGRGLLARKSYSLTVPSNLSLRVRFAFKIQISIHKDVYARIIPMDDEVGINFTWPEVFNHMRRSFHQVLNKTVPGGHMT